MSAIAAPQVSPTEYLERERAAEFRSEYVNGQIFAMAGASEEHNIITVNVVIALGNRLRGGPCRPFANDLRVLVPQTGLYTYPDVAVTCGTREWADDKLDILMNPTLLLEVLSPSTEVFDREAKFVHYRELATLAEYVLVAQDRPRVEHYARTEETGGAWRLTIAEGLDSLLTLPVLGCAVPLREIYDGIEFTEIEFAHE